MPEVSLSLRVVRVVFLTEDERFKDMLEVKYGSVTRLGKAGRPFKEQ